MGLVYGCTISNSVKFFPDKRGMIGGIATASYGISSVLIPPVANMLINQAGVLAAFKLLGIAFLIIICCGACAVSYLSEDDAAEKAVRSLLTAASINIRQRNTKCSFYYIFMTVYSERSKKC